MIAWLTTAPDPRSRATGVNAGQRGWRLHAVYVKDENVKFDEIPRASALCGVIPSHGWSLDMFIEDKCLRCQKKVRTL